MIKLKSILIILILFGSMIHAEELKLDVTNERRIALDCSGKHPGRSIKHTILFLIDREKDVLQESRYCGSFEEVDIVLGSTKDNQFVWYSPSPFVINGYGEKILNLKELKFEYRQTWRQSYFDEKGQVRTNNVLIREKTSWSAQCNMIDWEDAIKLEKELRC